MLYLKYLLILFSFFYTCCIEAVPLIVDGDAFKDAKILQEVFANIQTKPHFFGRNYVIELMGYIEEAFNEMLKHPFCEQAYKQLATTIHSTNIKAGAVVGDIAVHFGLLNTEIIRARLMLAMMVSFNGLRLIEILGILSIEECQKYVDAVISDLDDFTADVKKKFKDSLLPQYPQIEQEGWGKKKYLLLAFLLLGLTITIIIGYKVYQKNVEVNKHRQEIAKLMKSLADVKMAIGMDTESLQKKISALSKTMSDIEQKSGVLQSVSEVVEKMKLMSKDLTKVKDSVSENAECLKEFGNLVGAMDTVLRDNASATQAFVEAAKERTEELENTSKKQRSEMQKQLDEMREYVEELDEIAGNVSENSKWYDDILPSFSSSDSMKLFTKATATITAAGAAKKLATSLSGLGSSDHISEGVSSWGRWEAAQQRFARSK